MLAWFFCCNLFLTCVSLMWYIRELLKRFRYLSLNSYELSKGIERYREHLQSVYELPMFYGDQTLKGLMDHTKDLSAALEELQKSSFYLMILRRKKMKKKKKSKSNYYFTSDTEAAIISYSLSECKQVRKLIQRSNPAGF